MLVFLGISSIKLKGSPDRLQIGSSKHLMRRVLECVIRGKQGKGSLAQVELWARYF